MKFEPYVVHPPFPHLRVCHHPALLICGTRSQRHLCILSIMVPSKLLGTTLPAISSGKIESRTSRSSFWSSTPIATTCSRDPGYTTEAFFWRGSRGRAPRQCARATEILRNPGNFWTNFAQQHNHFETISPSNIQVADCRGFKYGEN